MNSLPKNMTALRRSLPVAACVVLLAAGSMPASGECQFRILQRAPYGPGGVVSHPIRTADGNVTSKRFTDVMNVSHTSGSAVELRLHFPGKPQEERPRLKAGERVPTSGSFPQGSFLTGYRCLDANARSMIERLRRQRMSANGAYLQVQRDFDNLTPAMMAKEFSAAGYPPKDIFAMLESKMSVDPETLAVIGKLDRFDVVHVARSLVQDHRASAGVAADALYRGKYSLTDVAKGLKEAYRLDRAATEQELARLGQPASTVARALDGAFGRAPAASGSSATPTVTGLREGSRSGGSFSLSAHFPLTAGRPNQVVVVGRELAAIDALRGLPSGFQARVVGKNDSEVRFEIRVPRSATKGKLYRADLKAGPKVVAKLNFRVAG